MWQQYILQPPNEVSWAIMTALQNCSLNPQKGQPSFIVWRINHISNLGEYLSQQADFSFYD